MTYFQERTPSEIRTRAVSLLMAVVAGIAPATGHFRKPRSRALPKSPKQSAEALAQAEAKRQRKAAKRAAQLKEKS